MSEDAMSDGVVWNGFTQAALDAAYNKVAYDTINDFEPIIEIVASPNLFVATAASGLKWVSDLVAEAKRQPGRLTVSTRSRPHRSCLQGRLSKVALPSMKLPGRLPPKAAASATPAVSPTPAAPAPAAKAR